MLIYNMFVDWIDVLKMLFCTWSFHNCIGEETITESKLFFTVILLKIKRVLDVPADLA